MKTSSGALTVRIHAMEPDRSDSAHPVSSIAEPASLTRPCRTSGGARPSRDVLSLGYSAPVEANRDPCPRVCVSTASDYRIEGVYHILATPFSSELDIDEPSLRRLVSSVLALAVDGLTILGVAGEAQTLSVDERTRLTAVVSEVVDGRVPIIVGTSADALDQAIARSRAAELSGASAVMVAPPRGADPDSLIGHYRTIAESITLPIVLHDYPDVTDVDLTIDQMVSLVEAVPSIVSIKLESVPSPPRVGAAIAALEGAATVLGGRGGLYYLNELKRGASGTMTGFAFPEALVDIWRHWQSGDTDSAEAVYYRYLPLLVFEAQPSIGLAIRKETLRRRDMITSATLRRTSPALDDGTLADLSDILGSLGVKATM
jgi:4-hydroxy-tetrahydrodipicolinate synthase